ncbi:hypothetical protein [Acinetobacter sp. MD2(2019)]|uniref:hypothetical protein n=1 Tax=Acinetobacter sp. MD2(2019) TaxID=2605273 RepID=UPI002D1F96CA|nr:hypothetical protein [Acinetobacter sp. MD2(2019)]MEB3753808.1 hypothetical protein [Acinetobacter sp. MD2(2019)]
MQITAVFVERESGSHKMPSAELKAKAWIVRNLKAGLFEQRKEAAIMFSNPCFQHNRYSANQRIAYNNAKYN